MCKVVLTALGGPPDPLIGGQYFGGEDVGFESAADGQSQTGRFITSVASMDRT